MHGSHLSLSEERSSYLLSLSFNSLFSRRAASRSFLKKTFSVIVHLFIVNFNYLSFISTTASSLFYSGISIFSFFR